MENKEKIFWVFTISVAILLSLTSLFSALTISIYLLLITLPPLFLWRRKYILVGVFILFSFLTMFNPGWMKARVEGDGVGYFSYLRSWVYDHDLDFENEFELLNAEKFGIGRKTKDGYRRLKKTGMVRNPFSIGPAILWFPGYYLASRMFHFKTGYEPELLTIIKWEVWIYGLAGVFLLFLFLRKYFSVFPSFFSIFSVLLASPLFYYLRNNPFLSHVPSFFSVSLLLYLLSRVEKNHSWFLWILIGSACGLCFLIRWQNGLLLLLPLLWIYLDLIKKKMVPRREILNSTFKILLIAFFFILVTLPQFLVFKLLYGTYLTVPQGKRFVTLPAYLLSSLFSPFHGLFNWHPFLIVAIFGFLFSWRRRPRLNALALSGFSLEALVNGSLREFWAGASFGARRYVGSLPFLSVGFSNLVSKMNKKGKIFFVFFLNLFFFLNFFAETFYARGVIPAEIPFSFGKILGSIYKNFPSLHIKLLVFFVLYLFVLNVFLVRTINQGEGTTGPQS